MPDSKPDGLPDQGQGSTLDRDNDLGMVYDNSTGLLKKFDARYAFPSSARGKDSGAWVSVFDYGALADGSDDRIAIIVALLAVGSGGTVYFPAGTYNIGVGLGVLANSGVHLVGEGPDATILSLAPTTDGYSSIILSNAGSTVVGNSIRDMAFTTADNLYNKTAIWVADAEHFEIDNVRITGFDGASTDSVGLRFEGVQYSHVSNLRSEAVIPVRISVNPNHTDGADSVRDVNFHNSTLISPSNNPDTLTKACVLIDEGVEVNNLVFDGVNRWDGADYGLYMSNDGTPAIDDEGTGITLSGVTTSGGDDNANAYSVYVDSYNGKPLKSLLLQNCSLEADRNGVYVDYVRQVTLSNCDLGQTSARTAINSLSSSSVNSLNVNSCQFDVTSSWSLANSLVQVSGTSAPANATYPATGEWAQMSPSVNQQIPNTLMNGVQEYCWQGSVNNGSTVLLPFSANPNSMEHAVVEVTASPEDGDSPALQTMAHGKWLVSTLNAHGSTNYVLLVYGTPNTAQSDTANSLCLYATSPGNTCFLKNNLGDTAAITVRGTMKRTQVG